jgi:hypothetical protein
MKLTLWLASLIVSSLVTLAVTYLWQAPRAVVEVTSFELSPRTTGSSGSIRISPDLVNDLHRHAYLSNAEKVEYSAEDFAEMLGTDKQAVADAVAGEALIAKLTSLVTTQSQAVSVERRRRDFLMTLVENARIYKIVEDFLQLIAVNHRSEFDAKYSAAPFTTVLSVQLDEGNQFHLSDIDADQVASQAAAKSDDVNTYARVHRNAEKTLMFRRLIRLYEPDDLLRWLGLVSSFLVSSNADASTLIRRLEGLVRENKAARLVISVVVSNRGALPLVVRQYGLFRLIVPNDNKPGIDYVSVPVSAEKGGENDVVIVDGGKSTALTYLSDQTLDELVAGNAPLLGGKDWSSQDVEQSRLVRLFRAHDNSLTGQLRLTRAEFDPDHVKVVESEQRPLSVTSRSVVLESLLK